MALVHLVGTVWTGDPITRNGAGSADRAVIYTMQEIPVNAGSASASTSASTNAVSGIRLGGWTYAYCNNAGTWDYSKVANPAYQAGISPNYVIQYLPKVFDDVAHAAAAYAALV